MAFRYSFRMPSETGRLPFCHPFSIAATTFFGEIIDNAFNPVMILLSSVLNVAEFDFVE